LPLPIVSARASLALSPSDSLEIQTKLLMGKNVSKTNGIGSDLVGMLAAKTFGKSAASLANDFKVMDNPDSH
jgi:hypothetical protein